jgi:peroxiredoxin
VENILVISTILLWMLMLFNILLTVGLARRIKARLPHLEPLKVGQKAPDFTAWTLEAEPVSLAHYAEHRVALVFVSPTCNPCREEVSTIVPLQLQRSAGNLLVVFVSDADEEDTKQLASELNITQPVLIAPRDRTSFLMDYKVNSTPAFCILNAGKVEATGSRLSEIIEDIAVASPDDLDRRR